MGLVRSLLEFGAVFLEFSGRKKVSKRSLEVDLYVLINKVKSANNTSVYENYKRCVSGHVVILL